MKRWKMILVDVTDPDVKSETTPAEVETWAKTARAAVVGVIESAGPSRFSPGRYRVSVWQVDADGAPVRAAKTSIYTVKWAPVVEESEADVKALEPDGEPDDGTPEAAPETSAAPSGFVVGFLEGLWKRWKDRR